MELAVLRMLFLAVRHLGLLNFDNGPLYLLGYRHKFRRWVSLSKHQNWANVLALLPFLFGQ